MPTFGNLISQGRSSLTTGWADYADTQYTSATPFSVSSSTDTLLPNNGMGGIKTYEPSGVTLYDATNQKITGIEGENRVITLDFKARPIGGGTHFLETWFDIGGTVGQLYRNISSFPQGNGVEREVTQSLLVYTLNTWEANGADVYVRSNSSMEIYDIRYVIYRP